MCINNHLGRCYLYVYDASKGKIQKLRICLQHVCNVGKVQPSVFCQGKPHENPTNQGSENIHNSQLWLGKKITTGLPKKYTKEDLLVHSWKVATAQKLKKWKRLSCVADKVIKDNWNVNVELLIAANCTRALEPIKVETPAEMMVHMWWRLFWVDVLLDQEATKTNQKEKYHAIGQLWWKLAVTRLAETTSLGKTPDDDVKSMLKKIYE